MLSAGARAPLRANTVVARAAAAPAVRRKGAGGKEGNAGARAPLRANTVVAGARAVSPVRLFGGFKINQAVDYSFLQKEYIRFFWGTSKVRAQPAHPYKDDILLFLKTMLTTCGRRAVHRLLIFKAKPYSLRLRKFLNPPRYRRQAA